MSTRKRPAIPFDPDAAALPGSGIFGLPSTPEESAVIVLPVPFDATTSYGGGAANAPEAILAASHQVDLFDLQTGKPYEAGIAMLPIPPHIKKLNTRARKLARPVIAAGGPQGKRPLMLAADDVNKIGDQVNAWVFAQTRSALANEKIVITLGGDHSVPFGAINAYVERYSSMGILHIDAHCDLRVGYEGFTWSHASIFHNVMTRLNVKKLVQVGVRDLSAGECDFAEKLGDRIALLSEPELQELLFEGEETWREICEKIAGQLPEQVYLSVDIDGFDPSLCPHTGTPVPGGLSFPQFTELLTTVVRDGHTILGGDLCEVSLGPADDEWDANVGARVLYKMIGFALLSRD